MSARTFICSKCKNERQSRNRGVGRVCRFCIREEELASMTPREREQDALAREDAMQAHYDGCLSRGWSEFDSKHGG